jgi:hypothetical protein
MAMTAVVDKSNLQKDRAIMTIPSFFYPGVQPSSGPSGHRDIGSMPASARAWLSCPVDRLPQSMARTRLTEFAS